LTEREVGLYGEVKCVMMEQGWHIVRLTGGKYFDGKTSDLEGCSGLKPVLTGQRPGS